MYCVNKRKLLNTNSFKIVLVGLDWPIMNNTNRFRRVVYVQKQLELVQSIKANPGLML